MDFFAMFAFFDLPFFSELKQDFNVVCCNSRLRSMNSTIKSVLEFNRNL